MKILIDLQGAQSESRFRGIGRYAVSMAMAMVRHRKNHDIHLALNGSLRETLIPLREMFGGLLPPENIHTFSLPEPLAFCNPENHPRIRTAQCLREHFLRSLRPDVLVVTSLFEGFIDNAVTGIGDFDTDTPVALCFYDLIPFIHPDQYLKPNPLYETFYMEKITCLKKAALLFPISESSAREAVTHLGFSEERVISTPLAADAIFRPLSPEEADAPSLRKKFGITLPFLLYSGGADRRKNLPRLIQAHARMRSGLRKKHCLVIAGKISEHDRSELAGTAKKAGLRPGELIFTGHVTDEELVRLYNLCRLFVFPSWHEGFGLPPLEAMACGAVVIGANATSVPEVIAWPEALFDPFCEKSMAQAMERGLTDEAFRESFSAHARKQVAGFSWDISAKRLIQGLERLRPAPSAPPSRPRLAFISPLPPERTGIADYSAQLLPELARFYDMDLILNQDGMPDASERAHLPVRDVPWLQAHAHEMDRFLYHMGNAPCHQYVPELLKAFPGVVVLHDFYLGNMRAYLEAAGYHPRAFTQALLDSHGYAALRCLHREGVEAASERYPVNLDLLQNALGIITHSAYARSLVSAAYGFTPAETAWHMLPLLRTPPVSSDRQKHRKALGFSEKDFVVCSFGFIDAVKLSTEILEAFLHSGLAAHPDCHLLFAGQNHGGDYGRALEKKIQASGIPLRIRITGWLDTEEYGACLQAADLAVQLRARSRGETSAAVMDCMNHGLPTIVNACGAMAELPPDTVYLLPEAFSPEALVTALETLRQNRDLGQRMGEKARAHIQTRHSASACAALYHESIEAFHRGLQTRTPALMTALSRLQPPLSEEDLPQTAAAIARSFPPSPRQKCLFLDITATCGNDLKTGIERVARALTLQLLLHPPEGFRTEPVYLSQEGGAWHYRLARTYSMQLLECPEMGLADEIAELFPGDLVTGLDLSGPHFIGASRQGFFTDLRNTGVRILFMVHDLLPVRMPDVFPPGADAAHRQWLEGVSRLDGAICVSQSVAQDLDAWLRENRLLSPSFRIRWSHHGADMENSHPSRGLPENAGETLLRMRERPSFLMVGTLEPRKGHLQTLEAFSRLWRQGHDLCLVIVGREGWKGLTEDQRRTIPEIMENLKRHPELGKRLFWLDGISDDYLEKVYAAATCLVASSEGEGFGLPLIEAAQKGLPIIARDIPVFREVAGEHAFYFRGMQAQDLAEAVTEWLRLHERGEHPESRSMPWKTWKESAETLKAQLLDTPSGH